MPVPHPSHQQPALQLQPAPATAPPPLGTQGEYPPHIQQQMDNGSVPLDPFIPRKCLEDPWAKLSRWGATWWPYCTLCNAWSDTQHIASYTHKKRLGYYNIPVVHHQRSFHPSSPVASAPAQRGFAPAAASTLPGAPAWACSEPLEAAAAPGAAAAAVVPMDVAAPPPPSPPTSEDIFVQGLRWRLFDFQHIESI